MSVLRLDNNRLDVLPASYANSSLASSLTKLYMRNNSFSEQALTILSTFTKLKHLYLDGNAITAIQPTFFRHLNNLQILSLSNNRIARLHNDSFRGIERVVTTLNLARNRIEYIDVGTFTSLYYIRHLDLSDNRIAHLTLPAVLPSLNYLSVARNRLTEFPSGLRSCPLLLTVDLSFNQIARLRRFDFFSSNRIQLINFANNRLENIDDVGYLGTVDVLDFSWNRLSDIAADILNRTTIVQLLDLSHNRFIRVPSVITRASDVLIGLRLDHNNISSLSHWIGPTFHRSDLEVLSLRGNLIDELSPNLMSAVRASLTQLDLRDNRLTTIHQRLFDDIPPYLTQLLLSGNPLHCDCRLAWLRELDSQVTIDAATCSSPSEVAGSLVVLYGISSCENFTDDMFSSSTAPPTTTTTESGRIIDNVALVIGVAIAVAVLLVVTVLIVCYCIRRRSRHRYTSRTPTADLWMTNGTLDTNRTSNTDETSDPPPYSFANNNFVNEVYVNNDYVNDDYFKDSYNTHL